MKKRKKKTLFIRIFVIVFLVFGAILGFIGYNLYSRVYDSNIAIPNNQNKYFYIHTGATYTEVFDSLINRGYIINKNTFDWVAEKKNYKSKVKPGRYLIQSGMSNLQLINLLRSGNQVPIDITINYIQTKNDLASLVGAKLEADSVEVLQLLNNESYLQQYDLNTENALCAILPNTYEFFWNTSAEQFFERMNKEYKRFWNDTRMSRANKLNLSPTDICVLASLVQKETSKKDEYTLVGGVYMNRLKKRMLLQADPALIYACNDFSIKRVLNKHKEIDSPYNTYRNLGLPPGPIVLPQLNVMDSLLNYKKHNYLFFCAKQDFSGYHNFAETYAQHLVYARKYHYTLDTAKIFK